MEATDQTDQPQHSRSHEQADDQRRVRSGADRLEHVDLVEVNL